MKTCAVTGCTNYAERDRFYNGISFHSLPTDKERRLSWMAILGKRLPMSAMICSIHFRPECYVWKGSRLFLLPDAVPTLYLEQTKKNLSKKYRPCLVPGCKRRDTADSREAGITFHKIPQKNSKTRKKWLKAMGIQESELTYGSLSMRVCSDHFLASDFQSEDPSVSPIRALKIHAVPSVFQVIPSSEEKEITKASVTVNSSSSSPPPELLFDFIACEIDDNAKEVDPTSKIRLLPESGNQRATTPPHCEHNYAFPDDVQVDEFPKERKDQPKASPHQPRSDHNYCYPNDLDTLREKCEKLREALRRQSNKLQNARLLNKRLKTCIAKSSAKSISIEEDEFDDE